MKYFLSLIIMLACISNSTAQYSTDATNPFAVCSAANTQNNVRAIPNDLTPGGGTYIFWMDYRSATALYGQLLDEDGNKLWETDGRILASAGLKNITGYNITRWQQGILVTYVIAADSVVCMYINSNGQPLWAEPVSLAQSGYPILGISAEGCLNVFPTSTGAAITFYITYFGGAGGIGYNKIDFAGNVAIANNGLQYSLSGYDYRSVSDGEDGLYLLSKGNGLGSSITIDRINSDGAKIWPIGIDITEGGGSRGFGGNISMNISTSHDLFVTWDAYTTGVLHTKVFKTGSFGWGFKRLTLNATSNAGASFATISSNDSVYTCWIETPVSNTNVMVQKIGADGGLSLQPGGKAIGQANSLYARPKITTGNNGDDAVCVFTINASTVAIGMQGLRPDNSSVWDTTKIISDKYGIWNSYSDFTVLPDAANCNKVFWSGFDYNIYGADPCKISDPVPIRAGSVAATNEGLRNKITWQGYNQMSGDVYEVQRSQNGIHFVSVATIKATGIDNSYSYWDENPVNGINYYRIKLITANGKIELSNIANAVVNMITSGISAYPNPVKNILNIYLKNDTNINGIITINDMSGKKVKSQHILSRTSAIDVSNLLKGIYLVTYTDGTKKMMLKILKD